jgi:uncharacterized membrane protein
MARHDSNNAPSSDASLGFPKSTAQIAGHPLHPMLITFPVTFFLSTLVLDLVFLATGGERWAEATVWVLGAGLVTALAAAATGMTDYLGDDRVRRSKVANGHMIGNIFAVGIEAANWFLRLGGDAEDVIVPEGIALSAIAAAILGVTAWLGGSLVYKQRVGVSPPGSHPL